MHLQPPVVDAGHPSRELLQLRAPGRLQQELALVASLHVQHHHGRAEGPAEASGRRAGNTRAREAGLTRTAPHRTAAASLTAARRRNPELGLARPPGEKKGRRALAEAAVARSNRQH